MSTRMFKFTIKVLHSSGKSNIKVSIVDEMTVLELKDLITEIKGINKDLQCVIFKGKKLKDDEDLTKLGVHNKTIMVLHREPSMEEGEVPTETPKLSQVIEYILQHSDPPSDINVEGSIASEGFLHSMHTWLLHIKFLMQQLRNLTGDRIPHQLEYLDTQCLQTSPERMMKLCYCPDKEDFQLTFFFLELNHLCQFFAPFLQYYGDIVHQLEMSTCDQERDCLMKINELVNDLTHHFDSAYKVLKKCQNDIKTRRNNRCASLADDAGPSQVADGTIILDSMLFDPCFYKNVEQLAHPIDVIYILESPSEANNRNEDESQVDLDITQENEATASDLSSGTDAESQEPSTPNTESKKDEKSP